MHCRCVFTLPQTDQHGTIHALLLHTKIDLARSSLTIGAGAAYVVPKVVTFGWPVEVDVFYIWLGEKLASCVAA